MKRRISLVMILALLTLAMIFAISCDNPAEPPTDEEIWDEIMKNMDNLASFTSEGTLEYEFYSGDLRTSGVVSVEETINNLGGDDFKHSSEVINSYSYKYTDKPQPEVVEIVATTTDLYADGLYFSTYEKNGSVTKQNYAEVTLEEYFLIRNYNKLLKLPSLTEEGVECEYSKEDDGALSAVININDKSLVDIFSSALGLYAGTCDFEIIKYEFTFKSNNGEYIDEMEMRCIYDLEENEDEKTPKMIFKSSYDDFDCAEEIVNQYNTEDFTKIENIQELVLLNEKIKSILFWEDNAFNLSENVELKLDSAIIEDQTLDSEIICGTINGKRFLYSARTGSSNGVIRYYDGEKTTYVGSSKNKTEMTESEAWSTFLDSVLLISIDFTQVESVRSSTHGVYEFRMTDNRLDSLKIESASSDMEITEISYVISVTVKNGQITSAKSTIVLTCKHKGIANNVTVTMTNTVKW